MGTILLVSSHIKCINESRTLHFVTFIITQYVMICKHFLKQSSMTEASNGYRILHGTRSQSFLLKNKWAINGAPTACGLWDWPKFSLTGCKYIKGNDKDKWIRGISDMLIWSTAMECKNIKKNVRYIMCKALNEGKNVNVSQALSFLLFCYKMSKWWCLSWNAFCFLHTFSLFLYLVYCLTCLLLLWERNTI